MGLAKNPRKKGSQKEDSLFEFVQKNGKQAIRTLFVDRGQRTFRSKFDEFNRGDTVRYKNKVYVVKGYGSKGDAIGFVGIKKYFSTKGCRLIKRNTGITCI